ncbi:MAG: hypothetical protein EOL97_12665 [Spirochaetia bacterium]|nr:hypothetical protein [Spirochaetia bacterium]
MKVGILYYSKTGHTLAAAKAIAEGIKQEGSQVDIINANTLEIAILKIYDGIIFGSPCWGGCITNNGVATPITKALNKLEKNSLKDKIAGVYTIYAIKGGEKTNKTLVNVIAKKGCKKIMEGPIVKAGAVLSIGKGSSISDQDIQLLKHFGQSFVK